MLSNFRLLFLIVIAEFYTTEKTREVFDKNRKMVLGFRQIGKRHTAAREVTNVLGLVKPVNTARFANHTLNLEKIAFQMMTECMAQTAEWAKKN